MVKASVVIPTFNRGEALLQLLRQLCEQSIARDQYELVVVDDGSDKPSAALIQNDPKLSGITVHWKLNAGAAAARHDGALRASGELLIFLDDDMSVGRDFVEQHLAAHEGGGHKVVLGRMERDPSVKMPLFERWHAEMIEKLGRDAASGTLTLRGNHLFTGNASMRREDYLATGGFDPTLGHSEDVELGLRLEKAGCTFVFADKAVSLHGSDHTGLDKWLRRAFLYGRFDHRISRKHPDLPHANPWRLLRELHPMTRLLLAASVVAPSLSARVARAGMTTCDWLCRHGGERVALFGTSAAFTMQYFRGVRAELGSLGAAVTDARAYLTR